ncbi:C40 family peptidase [Pedobacter africanus]|uniref:CHAP domain-containing protein n=1 Tax=Pedobacter africanus TaxID=151894 RepID=A0A1W2AEQ4_9SPHI|nr:peptidoglycan-binding protein [Pedobacter africanus]SMC59209.1 hypothetical protein SAMN04488524_1357 [Pedobacter africanus]
MGIVLFGAIGGLGVCGSGGVIDPSEVGMTSRRDKVLSIARAEVGVREVGNNEGKRVREYLAYTGIKVPAAWCASYISWCFGKAGYDRPRTAWSPAMFPASRIVKEPKPADVFGVWFPDLKRIAHVGLVAEVKGDWIYSLEGNSNNNGSRNGDGVYQRLHHKRTVYKYADWVSAANQKSKIKKQILWQDIKTE